MLDNIAKAILKIVEESAEPLETKEIQEKINKVISNVTRTKLSYNSNYAKETQEMENVINIIKNKTDWTTPNKIAKKIVEEIIPERGEKFRYLIGLDGKYLIDAIYDNRDNPSGMDKVINYVMGLYLK